MLKLFWEGDVAGEDLAKPGVERDPDHLADHVRHRELLNLDGELQWSQDLGQMLQRFDNHPALAAAAYNAGPHRVERWLPEETQLPADVWIDTIPFRETRRYVRRVLSSDTVFDWRLNERPRRLSERLQPVPPRRGRAGD